MRVEAAATRLARPADPARALHPLRASDHRRRPDKLRAVGARLAPPSAHVTMHDYKQTVNKSMRAGDAQQRAGRRGRDICEQRGELAACGDQTACGRYASRRGRRLGRSGAAAPTRPLSETGDAVRGGPRSPRPAAGTGTAHPHLPGVLPGCSRARRHHSPLPLWQRASSSARPMHSTFVLIEGATPPSPPALQLPTATTKALVVMCSARSVVTPAPTHLPHMCFRHSHSHTWAWRTPSTCTFLHLA